MAKATQKEKLRKLERRAARALARKKPEDASSDYVRLEALEPDNPEWSRRLADCQRRTGNTPEEVEALKRACRKYARAGFSLKAIAMCSQVLARVPDDQESLEEIARLRGDRSAAVPPPGKPPPAGPPVAEPPPAQRPPPPPRKSRALYEPRAGAPQAAPTEPATSRATPLQEAPANSAPAGASAAPPQATRAHPSPAATSTAAAATPATSTAAAAPTDSRLSESVLGGGLTFSDWVISRKVPTMREAEWVRELDIELSWEEESLQSAPPSSRSLERVPLFSDVNGEILNELVRQARPLEIAPGEPVFSQGDAASAMYVVVEGRLRAARREEATGEVRCVAQYGEGDVFGEMGIVSNQPRGATITADQESHVLELPRAAINELCKSSSSFAAALLRLLRERFVDNLVQSHPMWSGMAMSERKALVDAFTFIDVDAGRTLVAQGHPAPGLFILLGGKCMVIARGEHGERCLAELSSGDVFGEMSLLDRSNALASVTTTSRSFLLRADHAAFSKLAMVHPALLEHVSQLSEERRLLNADALDELGRPRLRML